MDLELINPFLNEQDLEQFAPASVPKKKKLTLNPMQNETTKDRKHKTYYTEEKAGILVVITWKIAKHGSYSGIVGSCPYHTQGNYCSLKHPNEDIRLNFQVIELCQ